MDTNQTQPIHQFLNDETELLQNLAFDVADAKNTYEYHEAKIKYDIQFARVTAIKEAIALASM